MWMMLPAILIFVAYIYVMGFKAPWYIDLLNINIDNHELSTAGKRIIDYMDTLKKDNSRITKNVDF